MATINVNHNMSHQIWKGDSTGGCTRPGFKNCTASEISDLNGYMGDFIADMKRTPTFLKPGNGAL